jgi:hypothetical protein
MTATERSLFVERELAREGGATKAFGAQIVRQVQDGGPKDEVLLAVAPRESLDRLLAPFLGARLTPRLVATAPLALVKAAQALSPIPFDRPTIVGHWGLSGLTMAVVSDGVLTLARQIPLLAVGGVDPVEWVVTEIQRSMHHYSVLSKGEAVERALFGGAEVAQERMFSNLGELGTRLRLHVLDLNQLLRPLLPDGAEEDAGLPAGAFLLAFGAALLSPQEAPNLLPPAISSGWRSRQITRTALAAAILLALVLGGSFWAANREAAALRHTLERQRTTRQSLQAGRGEVERIEAERQQARRWTRLLSDDPLDGPPLADALKEVSRLAPDELRLERLVVAKGDRGYAMKLAGVVKQADLALAQSAFNQLYFGLRESPFFYDVSFLPQADKKEGGQVIIEGKPREAVKAAEQQLAFELTLRLREMRQ